MTKLCIADDQNGRAPLTVVPNARGVYPSAEQVGIYLITSKATLTIYVTARLTSIDVGYSPLGIEHGCSQGIPEVLRLTGT